MSNINLCDCEENWMEIKNKKGKTYYLSSKGRLKRILKNKKEKYSGSINKIGYVIISTNVFSKFIHRSVYRYFFQINIEEYDRNYNEIDHINTIRNHNCICNLKCGSQTENNNNSLTCKKRSESLKGENNGMYGKKGSMYGKKHTEESLRKMRKPKPKYLCQYCQRPIGGKYNLTRHEKICNKN